MKKSRRPHGRTAGIRFPEDEGRLPWLSALLDAYALADDGIAAAVRQTTQARRAALACRRGCDVCCRQRDIPLYPHELVGIYWYASEKLPSPVREIVKNNLAQHTSGGACPFLVESACTVHPVRPLACRQFNVFGRSCAPGEDPYHSRQDDVLPPLPAVQEQVFARVLPLYRLHDAIPQAEALRLVRRQIMNATEFDWTRLVPVMEQAERRRTP